MKFGDMLIVGMLAFGVWSAMRKPKGKIQFDPTNGLPVPPEYFKPLPSKTWTPRLFNAREELLKNRLIFN